jgi:hypothetical protein
MMRLAAIVAVSSLASPLPQAAPAPQRPRADVIAVRPSLPAAAGSTVTLTLKVHLPDGIHVQGDRPRDPSLIATTLGLTLPAGVTIDRLVFPAATELVQAGQSKPLLVFGNDFAIDAHLAVSAAAAPGELKIPAVLRYQACNDRLCFAPARATAEWTLTISPPLVVREG